MSEILLVTNIFNHHRMSSMLLLGPFGCSPLIGCNRASAVGIGRHEDGGSRRIGERYVVPDQKKPFGFDVIGIDLQSGFH
jgi:hypothetical protein